jgi:hypothetical protein
MAAILIVEDDPRVVVAVLHKPVSPDQLRHTVAAARRLAKTPVTAR